MPNPIVDRDTVVAKVADLVRDLILRRLKKIQGKDISKYLNVNPFLLSLLRDFHSFNSISDVAEFLFISHMAQGHNTSFGKLVDEKILPQVFGTVKLNAQERASRKMTAAAFNEIDHIINPDSQEDWCLLSLKAGAWTIQDSMAHNLYAAFKDLGDYQLYGNEIVVGVFYGKQDDLTNKYDILRGINPRQQDQFVQLKHVRVLAGKEFWSWLNGDEEETQLWLLEGTRQGSKMVFDSTGTEDIVNAPARLVEELARKYNLSLGGTIDWEKLLIAING